MTWADLAQLITAAAALGAVIMSWLNRRNIKAVHFEINSRMTELLNTTRSEANLTGRAELRDEQQKKRNGGKKS